MVSAIYEAGERLLEQQPFAERRRKPDGTAISLDRRTGRAIDEDVESSLFDAVLQAFPDATLLGEEMGLRRGGRDHATRAVIDPLDGTALYLQQLNFFAVSVLIAAPQPWLAVIHQPGLRRWHAASFSGGADWLASASWFDVRVDPAGGLVLEARSRPKGPDVTAAFDDCYLDVSSDAHSRLDLSEFRGKIRAHGATAASLAALLKDGTTDPRAVAVTRAKVWDVAAGLVLLRAAGLELLELEGRRPLDPERLLEHVLHDVSLRSPSLIASAPGDGFASTVRVRKV